MSLVSDVMKNMGGNTSGGQRGGSGSPGRPHYEPAPINQEEVLSQLDKVAYEAAMAYYYEVNKGMIWYEEMDESRYRAYFRMPFEELVASAEEGNPVAQYVLGDYYAEKEEMVEAVKWFRCSAEAGNPSGQYYYGLALMYGWAGESDEEKAMIYLRQAAMAGLCYEASEAMVEWLTKQMDSAKGYDYIEESIHWSANLAHGSQGMEDEWLYNSKTSAACYLKAILDLEVLWSMGMEHIKDPNFKDYDTLERLTLMAYYFERKARATNQLPEDAVGCMEDLLCAVGEIAWEKERSYAADVLRLAAEMGSDYAAALAAKPLLREAVSNHVSQEATENSFFFHNTRERMFKILEQGNSAREKAHTLAALAEMYVLGGGTPVNATKAYQCLSQAADMNYPFAKQTMELFERRPNGEYHVKR